MVTGMIRAFVVLWTALVAPRAAARRLAALSPRAVVGVVLLHAWTAGLLAAGTWWVTQTRTIVWVPTPVTVPTTGPTTAPASGPVRPLVWTMTTPHERRRTLAEVWRDAHAGAGLGPMEGIAVGCVAALVGLTLALACAFLSCVHRGGTLRSAAWRAWAAAAPGSVPLTLGVIVILAAALLDFAWRPAGTDLVGFNSATELACVVILPVCLLLAIVCTARAAACVGRTLPAEAAAPLCEGCGYNLTGHTGSQRCPECGRPVSDSVPPQHRTGPAWESDALPALGRWICTTARALFRPKHFYRTLAVRQDVGKALSFEAMTFAGLVFAGLDLALCLLAWNQDRIALEDLIAVAFVTVWAGLLTWAGHRALATLVTMLWLLRGAVRDGWAAARVAAYESAFVWPVIAWCLGLGLSFFYAGPWISALLDPSPAAGRRPFLVLGTPIDIWIFFGGLGGLIVIWTVRYSIALRAVRWANA